MSDTDTSGASPEPGPDPAPGPGAPANPFLARYREPWVNPARKGAMLALAAAAAVVLLAVGVLLGIGLGGGGHGGGHQHELRMVLRHPAGYGPPHGWTGYRPRGRLGVPAKPAPPLQSQPVPSSSHS